MASSSKEQELAIKIAGKVENSFKQSLGVTEDGLNKIASVAKKAAAVAAAAFAAVKVGDFISGAGDEYAEFEQAMANTSAIAGASADDYAKLSAAAREAGKATTFTASEAADALGYMALAGCIHRMRWRSQSRRYELQGNLHSTRNFGKQRYQGQ